MQFFEWLLVHKTQKYVGQSCCHVSNIMHLHPSIHVFFKYFIYLFYQNCSAKESVLVPEYNQKIALSPSNVHSGCHRVLANKNSKTYNYNCGGNMQILNNMCMQVFSITE